MSETKNDAGRQRALVLGGGIVGACCAYALQRDGYDTIVLEKDTPGRAASFGNSASIGLASIPPLGMPGMMRDLPRMLRNPLGSLVIRARHLPRTLPWLMRFRRTLAPERVEAIADARAALLSHAGSAYESLLAEIRRTELISTTGLIFAWTNPDGLRSAQAGIAMRRKRGIEAVELDGAALRALEPALSDQAACGVHYPIVQTVTNPLDLTLAVLDAFRARGGRVLCETARGFETKEGRVAAIVTDGGRREADLVVVAAGAWSSGLARMLGDRIPVIAERGYHVMVDHAANLPQMPIVSGDHNVSIVSLNTGLRLTTMAELTAIEAAPDHARALRIFRAAAPLIRGLELDVASRWVGARPSTPDSLPVIGRASQHRNVIYAFGHGHLGVTFGAVTARIVATLARDERPNIDTTPYRPNRGFDGSEVFKQHAA